MWNQCFVNLPWLIIMFWFIKWGSFGYFGRWQNLLKGKSFTFCCWTLRKIIYLLKNLSHLTLLVRPGFRSSAELVGRWVFVWPVSVRQEDFFEPHGEHAPSRGSGESEVYRQPLTVCSDVKEKKFHCDDKYGKKKQIGNYSVKNEFCNTLS